MGGPRVGVVIPALNEAASIVPVVTQARRFGLPIVVDDGSVDDTGTLAKAAGASVVRHAGNRGYDAALNSGFARAAEMNCEIAITVDADGQHNPALLEQFLAEFDQGADVVIGVRDHHQRLAESVFAWLAVRLWKIRDPLCGMKGYRMDVYRALGHFDSYRSIGTELAIFAARRGFRIAQIPFEARERVGQPRFGHKLRGNWLIFRALALSLAATL